MYTPVSYPGPSPPGSASKKQKTEAKPGVGFLTAAKGGKLLLLKFVWTHKGHSLWSPSTGDRNHKNPDTLHTLLITSGWRYTNAIESKNPDKKWHTCYYKRYPEGLNRESLVSVSAISLFCTSEECLVSNTYR